MKKKKVKKKVSTKAVKKKSVRLVGTRRADPVLSCASEAELIKELQGRYDNTVIILSNDRAKKSRSYMTGDIMKHIGEMIVIVQDLTAEKIANSRPIYLTTPNN